MVYYDENEDVIPSTITEEIDRSREYEISYKTLHNQVKIIDDETNRLITIPFSSIIDKYKDALTGIEITLEFDDLLRNKFRYRPKMLSNSLYGTTELWSEILRLNHCAFKSQFDLAKVKVYDPDKLKDYINDIFIFEDRI